MGKGSKGLNVPQSVLNSTMDLQNLEKSLLSQYSSIAIPGISSASNYYSDLLKGGPTAQSATAPYAQKIQEQAGVTQRNILNNLPAGGERNLALAQLPLTTGTNIANLYQGLGPQAASGLSGLSLGAAGAGTGSGGVSSSAGSSLTGLAGQQQQAKGSATGGIGAGLGSLAGGALGAKGTKGAASTLAAAV